MHFGASMKRANGKSKGPRMIHEIKRMNELGISRRKIALALSISRNTVVVSRQIKPLLKVLIFTRHQYEFAASAINSKFSW